MSEELKAPKPSLVGMIISPIQQLERIRGRPTVWGALLFIAVLTIISGLLQGMEEDTTGLEGKEAVEGSLILIGTAAIASIVGVLFVILIMSAVHMLIAKVALSTVSFKQLFSMNAHIGIITVLGAFLNGIVALIIGADTPGVMFTSLGSLVNKTGDMGAMTGLWDSIEVFSIWGFIVTALGLQIVAGFSNKLAWTIVIVLFLINIIFAMISSAIPGMVGV